MSLDEEELTSQKNNIIIVTVKTQMISREKAVELIKKYNTNKLIENLKINDNIHLIPYNQFRKDNPDIIEDFRRVSDSIVFSISLKGGKRMHVSKKIESINYKNTIADMYMMKHQENQ